MAQGPQASASCLLGSDADSWGPVSRRTEVADWQRGGPKATALPCELQEPGAGLLTRCVPSDTQDPGGPACRRAARTDSPDVLQRVALVDDDPARRAGVVLLQVLDQAAPADCVKAQQRQKASSASRCQRRGSAHPRPRRMLHPEAPRRAPLSAGCALLAPLSHAPRWGPGEKSG